MNSAIYQGEVYHRRFGGGGHAFRYRTVYFFFDLDELDDLARISPWFRVNAPGWFSYHDADHGERTGESMRSWLCGILAGASYPGDGWRFRVLTMPRMLGYVFNPICVVFCEHPDSGSAATIYEVNNTFGERVAYLAPVAIADGTIRQRCDKSMFVSPFFKLGGHYDFAIDDTADRLRIAIDYHLDGARRLHASFSGRRQPFDAATLRRIAVTQSATTLKVTAAIHFEALRVWLRGNRLVPRRRAVKTLSIGTKL
jgi:DUF1365 family protein